MSHVSTNLSEGVCVLVTRGPINRLGLKTFCLRLQSVASHRTIIKGSLADPIMVYRGQLSNDPTVKL